MVFTYIVLILPRFLKNATNAVPTPLLYQHKLFYFKVRIDVVLLSAR